MEEIRQNVVLGTLNALTRMADEDFQLQHWLQLRTDGKYNSIMDSALDTLHALEDHGLYNFLEGAEYWYGYNFSDDLYKQLLIFMKTVNKFKPESLHIRDLMIDEKWKEIIELAKPLAFMMKSELNIENDELFLM